MRARPGLVRWLWYAVGGRLPAEFREWVLFDLVSPLWVVRHLARALVQHSVWLLVLLLPVPWTLRVSMVAVGISVGVTFSLSFMEDACERRLIAAGFPVGLNRRIREETPGRDRAEVARMYTAWYGGDDAGQ